MKIKLYIFVHIFSRCSFNSWEHEMFSAAVENITECIKFWKTVSSNFPLNKICRLRKWNWQWHSASVRAGLDAAINCNVFCVRSRAAVGCTALQWPQHDVTAGLCRGHTWGGTRWSVLHDLRNVTHSATKWKLIQYVGSVLEMLVLAVTFKVAKWTLYLNIYTFTK